jgi:hypothetical protein
MPHEEEKNYMLVYEHGNGRSAIGSEYKSGGHITCTEAKL